MKKKTKPLEQFPPGTEWSTNWGLEGILIDICPGSADVVITKSPKDEESNQPVITIGRIRIANETEVYKLRKTQVENMLALGLLEK
tara:strand:+ start:409 stop:666 length:258 start_codon:yes stop_codon:yes gene_type:complete